MDILQVARELSNKSFFMHAFSSTDEGRAEILNFVQYAIIAVIPIIILNKIIQCFIPEADVDKSTLELRVEILLQIIVMFCGIIVIHRIITYIPLSDWKVGNTVLESQKCVVKKSISPTYFDEGRALQRIRITIRYSLL